VYLASLAPHFVGLQVRQLIVDYQRVTLILAPARVTAACPDCHRRSTRVHSHYERTVADLPWGDRPVCLRLQVRRFRCPNRTCTRRIFVERLPNLAPAYARRTPAQRAALEDFGFAAGGSAGARLANRRGVVGSRATILRLIHASGLPAVETPRVLGVDDWSLKRGRTYGTILLDLEQRRVVDLLEERTADVLANWLREHPGVEIIARDRGGAYADGARQGAPNAVQVADRFHLLANAGDALERVLARKHHVLRTVAATVDRENAARGGASTESPASGVVPTKRLTQHEQQRQDRRVRRQTRYEEVVRLFEQGMAVRAIGRQLRLSRKTVARYLRAGSFPECAPRRPRPSILSPYESYLRERWTAGCHNARLLWEEIHAQGFTGAASLVRIFVATWRTTPGRPGRPARISGTVSDSTAPPPRSTRVRSPRQARWLLIRPHDGLTTEEQTYRAVLLRECPEAETARAVVEEFSRLVRERDQAALNPWLNLATAGGVPELRAFAGGIGRDKAAVESALTYEWSNGQTEGQVNRLKFLKRQMYGRASFALLKRRVLRAA
jgi:transposase